MSDTALKNTPPASSDAAVEHAKLIGVQDYLGAIDTVVALAKNEIRVFDHSLENDGFNSVKRYDALRNFLLSSRKNRLRIVVHHTDYLKRYCPRMLMLLKQFSHSIQINRTHGAAVSVTDPFVIVDNMHFVRRSHFEDKRGLLALHDPKGAEALGLHFDELWAASQPAVSATTTGL
jgi:hypothetical protein